jgi:excisionase family DNA binding protein
MNWTFWDKDMRITEVARHLKISKSKAYSLVQRRKLPHVQIGRNVRVRQSDLKARIEKNLISQPAFKFGGRD